MLFVATDAAHRKDLRDVFDPEIEKMINLIWQQLASFRARDSKKKIVGVIFQDEGRLESHISLGLHHSLWRTGQLSICAIEA